MARHKVIFVLVCLFVGVTAGTGQGVEAPSMKQVLLTPKGFNMEWSCGTKTGHSRVFFLEKNESIVAELLESDARIKKRIGPLLGKEIPVIMGFMGCTGNGIVTTLGRSGSDYSASIIGAGIDADEIWIWTDRVDGIMTCDPRIINDGRVMHSLSYIEVMELSYFGAKVMHPRSIEPAMRKNILVRVKNTFNPSHPGTVIIRNGQRDNRVVKALTYIDKVAAININGAQMIGRPGVAKAIFTILADHKMNVMMISQGSSEANISLIVDEAHLNAAVHALADLVKQGIVREVTAQP